MFPLFLYHLPGTYSSSWNVAEFLEYWLSIRAYFVAESIYIEFNTGVDIDTVIAKFTNGILDITIKKLNSKNGGRAVKID